MKWFVGGSSGCYWIVSEAPANGGVRAYVCRVEGYREHVGAVGADWSWVSELVRSGICVALTEKHLAGRALSAEHSSRRIERRQTRRTLALH